MISGIFDLTKHQPGPISKLPCDVFYWYSISRVSKFIIELDILAKKIYFDTLKNIFQYPKPLTDISTHPFKCFVHGKKTNFRCS